jgi:HAD superfamily hydrolase (TIGR01484 family)
MLKMITTKMAPFAAFAIEQLKGIRVVLTDIDDTITRDGQLPAKSLSSMENLTAAGIHVIPVTGRPAGWCDHIARMWPVAAVVGENGALYYSYDHQSRKMRSFFAREAGQRVRDRKKLDHLAKLILEQVPGAGLATDQPYRLSDLAIDFREDVEPLSEEDIQAILQILDKGGATSKVSSIHVNAWFGAFDKLTTTRKCLLDLFAIDAEKDNECILFTGDSPNDEPMFAYFRHSVGVANVGHFHLQHEPAWITTKASADGFAEVADAILRVRGNNFRHGEYQ